jgi:hypothetical protein
MRIIRAHRGARGMPRFSTRALRVPRSRPGSMPQRRQIAHALRVVQPLARGPWLQSFERALGPRKRSARWWLETRTPRKGRLRAALPEPFVVSRAFDGHRKLFAGRALGVPISQRPHRPIVGFAEPQGAPRRQDFFQLLWHRSRAALIGAMYTRRGVRLPQCRSRSVEF